MSRNFAVVLIDGAEAQYLPTLQAHLRQGGTGWYFLACKIEPNNAYLHMTLARDGDSFGQRGIELQIPHQMVRYILASEGISQLGF